MCGGIDVSKLPELHRAAFLGDLQRISKALADGADIGQPAPGDERMELGGMTPLGMAVYGNL